MCLFITCYFPSSSQYFGLALTLFILRSYYLNCEPLTTSTCTDLYAVIALEVTVYELCKWYFFFKLRKGKKEGENC